MLLFSLDNDLLASRLRVRFFFQTENLELHCIHGEGKFMSWPTSPNTPPHINRMGNIQHVLRALGVDATATASARGIRARSVIDKRWNFLLARQTKQNLH